MADYKESAVVGTSWQRACRIQIENVSDIIVPGAVPTILIVEEKVTNLGTVAISQPVGNLSCIFDPANPDHVAAYTALNNIYVALCTARDAAEAANIPQENAP